jgi:3-methyl-2-oxobutanoate hydroxymethyltransferase
MTYAADTKPLKLGDIAKLRAAGEPIVMLTCYDASFAALLERCGVDMLLVGDSLGNVLQGHSSTLPVTLEQMIYHTGCVARGAKRAMIVADMPFGSYHESPRQAMRNAAQLMAAGAHMVKLEGGAFMAETVRFLVQRGVPVCAHIGLTPQSVNQLGGYRIQGKSESGAAALMADARALEEAGAALMVLEMIPAALGAAVTAAAASCAIIGIGAGPQCHGQVLVLHDMIGVTAGPRPRFAKNFMPDGGGSIEGAVKAYVAAVKARAFPAAEHGY